MIGLAEGTTGVFTCDYVTNEDCVIYSYQYEKEEDLKKIFEAQPKNAVVFLMSAVVGRMQRCAGMQSIGLCAINFIHLRVNYTASIRSFVKN